MKITLILFAIIINMRQVSAQIDPIEQLSSRGNSFKEFTGKREFLRNAPFHISYIECEVLNEIQGQDRPLSEIHFWERLCYQYALINEDQEITGFYLKNNSSNNINPRTNQYKSERTYFFSFPERSISQSHLKITDNSGITTSESKDLLETSIIFLPRKVIPFIEVEQVNGEQIRRVTISTEETVDFNTRTGEIIDGVFEEEKMDLTVDRHTRRFAGLKYSGKGIMIRADRRAGSPELSYDTSFNSNERNREATIYYKDQVCYVSKKLIWKNSDKHDMGFSILYHSDEELLNKVINPKCGWNLTLQDITI